MMEQPSAAEISIWQEEITAMKNRNVSGSVDELIVFYGSSSIRLWERMQQDLQPYQTLNLGFGGSSYFWCDYFFEEAFEGLHANHVVLYAGDNDLGSEHPVPLILANFKSLLSKIQTRFPGISLSVISVKPSPERKYLENRMAALNRELKNEIISRESGYYVDVFNPMLREGYLSLNNLFEDDNLHMNAKGYGIWKQVILEHLNAIHGIPNTEKA